MADKNYSVVPFPVEKIMSADGAIFNRYVELLNSVLEIDIEPLRQKVKQARQSGKGNVSVLACLLYCYGKALNKHKESFSLRGKGNKWFWFDDADAFFPVIIPNEDEEKFLFCKIIKSINKKTVYELEEDIRNAPNFKKTITPAERFFFRLPDWIKKLYYDYMFRNPLIRKQHGGNVYFTSRMHSSNGKNFSYIIPKHFHTTGMFVGTYKEVENAQSPFGKSCLLGITLSVDHIIGDGGLISKLTKEFLFQLDNITL